MACLKKLILVALSTQALDESPRRRLRDTVDLGHVKEKAEAEALTGALSFKLDGAAAAERGADALANHVAELIDCTSARRVFRAAGVHEAKHVAKGLHLWYAVKCAADDEGALEASRKAASKLEAYLELSDEDHEGVAIIEPGLVHLPLWTPNDPRYSDQQDHYDAVNLAQAWDTTQGNPNVVVQVLDTGLDLDHPDLQANIWRNEAAWASAQGGLTCAEVAVNASSRCHMRSVDGWAARDACACACDDVMYEPHGARRRLLRSKDSSIQGEHRALLDVRVPQASNQDDRREDGVAASA